MFSGELLLIYNYGLREGGGGWGTAALQTLGNVDSYFWVIETLFLICLISLDKVSRNKTVL